MLRVQATAVKPVASVRFYTADSSMSSRNTYSRQQSACHSQSSSFLRGHTLPQLRLARHHVPSRHSVVPTSKARTRPQSQREGVTAAARRRSTLLLPSSDSNVDRQAVQVRNAAETAPKDSDKALLVVASNVTVFRRSKSRSGTKIAAKPANFLQVPSSGPIQCPGGSRNPYCSLGALL